MTTQYPIKFNRGRLVKYTKPYKYIPEYHDYSYTLDPYSNTPLSTIVEWVTENGGKLEDTDLHITNDYGGDPQGEIHLSVPLSKEEKDQLEKQYQSKLKEYNEWLKLSKEAKDDTEIKNKLVRAKALKTQEQNLLNKLSKIRKEQDKL